jgi:glycerophosphoryl diester phosphodiesterase
MAARYPFLDHPGPIPFAHRGGPSTHLPENTLVAFQAAVDMGYRYLETDVHATRDGVLVAFHDEHLDRVTDRTGAIKDLPYSEVRLAKVGGTEPIPLFEDLVGAFPGARVNIEPKLPNAVGPLIAAIRRTASIERVCVGSFHTSHITQCRKALGPQLCTASGRVGIGAMRVGSYLGPLSALIGRTPAACYQIPVKEKFVTLTDQRFVDAAHRSHRQVHVWTIDHPAEIEHLLDLGVDGIMSDDIAALKEVLMRRGQWF